MILQAAKLIGAGLPAFLKFSRPYGHFRGVMSSSDFIYYGKLFLYRRRAHAYRHYYLKSSVNEGQSDAVLRRLDSSIVRVNLEMTRVCALYGLVPKNYGLGIEDFLHELDSFLDDNVKP